MADLLDQTEQIAAELLARGFDCPSHEYAAEAGPTGAEAGPSNDFVHKVLRLGWVRLCSVVCNGLRGELLGGHDRDVYVQATNREFAGLPPVDVSSGGSVMTCSAFERCAGRELSKKWKESIHVVGEGEGSRSTLLSWLRRRADREYGHAAVGRSVWVCWCADGDYYRGTITGYNPSTGKHQVQYSTRLAEDLHLPVELLSFEAEKPQLVLPCPGTVATSAPQQQEEAVAAAPRALWHQSSDVSVRSRCILEELGGGQGMQSTAAQASRPPRNVAPRRPRGTPKAVESSCLDDPPAKRAALGPVAGLLEAAAAATCPPAEVAATYPAWHSLPAFPAPNLQQYHPQQQGAVPVTPAVRHDSLAAAAVALQPREREALPPPPAHASDHSAAWQSSAMMWMHAVTLSLEPELEAAAQAAAGGANAPLPASGRFQTLLALARRDAHWVLGFFEAMASRHAHFAAAPALQRRKLAEFVLAALHEAPQQHDMQAVLAEAAGGP